MATNLLDELLPLDTYWSITERYKKQVEKLSPELYDATRQDPRRFAQLARAAHTPAPARAAGIILTRRGRRAVAEPKEDHNAKNPAPLSVTSQPVAFLDDEEDDYYDDEPGQQKPPPYDIVNGVALLSLSGPMTRKPTSAMYLIGGTSTILFRRKLLHAVRNPEVGAILIDVDSPGGTVAGTAELADDIADAAREKIVEAHVEALCASAAYWAVSGVRTLTVGRAAMVGSIGVYMVVEDLSELYNASGVKVTVVRAGKFKGAGEPGTPFTDEQEKDAQREVDELNDEFLESVQRGRRMNDTQVQAINTGQVWKGQQLIRLGLADAIGRYEGVLARLSAEVQSKGLAKLPDTVPGASASAASRASRSLLSLAKHATDPRDALVLRTAAARIEAERPAGLIQAGAAGLAAGEVPAPGLEGEDGDPVTPAPEPVADAPTDPAPTEEADREPGDTNDNPEGETEPMQEEPTPAPDAEPTDTTPEGETTPTDTTPPDAAGETVTEEISTMADVPTQNPPAPAAIDPGLAAALTIAGITGAAQLTSLVALAEDGTKARNGLIKEIAAYTARLEGAEAVDTEGTDAPPTDFLEIYGNSSYDSLKKIVGRMKSSYEAMMKHPAQAQGGAPLGSRMTTPMSTGQVSPALQAAINAGPQGFGNQNQDPTGTGVAPVNAADMSKRLNANRNVAADAALGKPVTLPTQ